MEKLTVLSENGDFEVNILEETIDGDAILKIIHSGECPDCGGEVHMVGHCNSGLHSMRRCDDCDTTFGIPIYKNSEKLSDFLEVNE